MLPGLSPARRTIHAGLRLQRVTSGQVLKPASERLILGIGAFAHDTSCALMRGGRVLFAAEQERFDRQKHSREYPFAAIDAGLRWLGLTFRDIDDIVVNYDPDRVTRNYIRHIWRWLPNSLRMLFDISRYKHASRSRNLRPELSQHFRTDLSGVGWHWVDHHLAHAASAFYRSPFDEAAILTSDALGEFESVMKAYGRGTRIEVLERIPFPHSIGSIYSAITDHLGFKVYSGEGTVMGLAGFGKLRRKFDLSRIARLTPGGGFEIEPGFFKYHFTMGERREWLSKRFVSRFGKSRAAGEPLEDRHIDLARALQDFTDLVLLHFCGDLSARTQSDRICYAGGVALNGYSNTRAMRDGPFREWFIQAAANDGGTALGAALYYSHHVLGIPRTEYSSDVFLGPDFTNDEIEQALRENEVSFFKTSQPAEEAARRLARDRIVGWVQGRMELGPRALGHRSILANPCRPWMKDHLNHKVKHREPFRPFAPIVPEERASEFFVMPCRSSPFMLLIMDVLPAWRERLPAITHIDGTARVQTVTSASDAVMHSLLLAFEREAGVPVLLNTSFNGPAEPIVCTPADAVRSFLKWGIDDLIIGDYVIERKQSLR
ncbi:MAG: carbamoyltransferase [Candidatus Riflebacteria bacterium]|nr:carbamoyltransferase [Candidatus Riflebacteria bacterium]